VADPCWCCCDDCEECDRCCECDRVLVTITDDFDPDELGLDPEEPYDA
jgi:hypothetical protein